MDEKKLIVDRELKTAIDKLLADAGVLLQIVSKLQDVRCLYLTDKIINTEEVSAEVDELEEKLQIIRILG